MNTHFFSMNSLISEIDESVTEKSATANTSSEDFCMKTDVPNAIQKSFEIEDTIIAAPATTNEKQVVACM